MKKKGFKPNSERIFPKDIFKEKGLYNDWIPEEDDYKIIRKCIEEKIALKPDWYRISR
jgi:histone acetyltransferase (RNA polymerase elongator complex component)